jgi:hypothetical protein
MIRRKRRRHRRFARLGWFSFAIFLSAGALVYLALLLQSRLAQPESVPGVESMFATPVRPAVEGRLSRPVYPYSVIRGGAYSVAELDAALIHDLVASAHYAGFHHGGLRMTNAPGPLRMYASYRMGDSVYWTSHPVHVGAGESLITDGTMLARARCGNQLSDSPREPVTRMEPMEREMETPEMPDLNQAVAPDTRAPGRILALGPPVSALAFEIFPPARLSAAPASPGSPGWSPFQTAPYLLPGARNPTSSSSWPAPAPPSSSPAAYLPPSAAEPGESSLQLTLQTFQQNVASTTVWKAPQVSLPVLPGVITGVEKFPGDDPLDPAPPVTTTSRLPPITGNLEPGEPLLQYGSPGVSIPRTNVVPEPVAGALLCAGVALLYLAKRRRPL